MANTKAPRTRELTDDTIDFDLLLGNHEAPSAIIADGHAFTISEDTADRLESVLGQPVSREKVDAYLGLHLELSFSLGRLDYMLSDCENLRQNHVSEDQIILAGNRREALQAKCTQIGRIHANLLSEYDSQTWGLGGRYQIRVPAGR